VLNRAFALGIVALLGSACSDPDPATCTYNGKTYSDGETFPAGDGCNTCTCTAPGIACTERACPPPDAGLSDGKLPVDALHTDAKSEGVKHDGSHGDATPSGIAFTTVGMGTGTTGSLSAQFNEVAADDASWKALLAKLGGTASGAVDFQTEVVAAVGLGFRPSGGYAAEIKRIDVVGGKIQVSYQETTPGEGCTVPTVVTRPWHAVKLGKQTAPFRFVLARVQAPACGSVPPVLCAAEKAAVYAELLRINHCVVASDCVVETGTCPFGCYFYREKSESTSQLQTLFQAHDAKCGTCSYKCAPPPTTAEIVCVGSICQTLLTDP